MRFKCLWVLSTDLKRGRYSDQGQSGLELKVVVVGGVPVSRGFVTALSEVQQNMGPGLFEDGLSRDMPEDSLL